MFQFSVSILIHNFHSQGRVLSIQINPDSRSNLIQVKFLGFVDIQILFVPRWYFWKKNTSRNKMFTVTFHFFLSMLLSTFCDFLLDLYSSDYFNEFYFLLAKKHFNFLSLLFQILITLCYNLWSVIFNNISFLLLGFLLSFLQKGMPSSFCFLFLFQLHSTISSMDH